MRRGATTRMVPPALFYSERMKRVLSILFLAGAGLCGCGQKGAQAAPAAVDLVQPEQEVVWADGFAMKVAERDGFNLEGIRIAKEMGNGQITILLAEKGTLSPGPDRDSVAIALFNVETQTGNNQMHANKVNVAFHR